MGSFTTIFSEFFSDNSQNWNGLPSDYRGIVGLAGINEYISNSCDINLDRSSELRILSENLSDLDLNDLLYKFNLVWSDTDFIQIDFFVSELVIEFSKSSTMSKEVIPIECASHGFAINELIVRFNNGREELQILVNSQLVSAFDINLPNKELLFGFQTAESSKLIQVLVIQPNDEKQTKNSVDTPSVIIDEFETYKEFNKDNNLEIISGSLFLKPQDGKLVIKDIKSSKVVRAWNDFEIEVFGKINHKVPNARLGIRLLSEKNSMYITAGSGDINIEMFDQKSKVVLDSKRNMFEINQEIFRLTIKVKSGMVEVYINGFHIENYPTLSVNNIGVVAVGNDPGHFLSFKAERLENKNIYDLFSQYIGLDEIKQQVKDMIFFHEQTKIRSDRGLHTLDPSMHLIFTGPPGSGKTEFARTVGKVFKSSGILSKGHFVEVSKPNLVGKYLGDSQRLTLGYLEEALGGVLFIDEAYNLHRRREDSFDPGIISTVSKFMEDHRSDIVVILAGYKKEMDRFLESNKSLRSRFNYEFEFKGYTELELVEILNSLAKKHDYIIDSSCSIKITDTINNAKRLGSEQFGEARFIRTLFEKACKNQTNRLAKTGSNSAVDYKYILDIDIPETNELGYTTADIADGENQDSLLNRFVGIEKVKAQFTDIVNLFKITEVRKASGIVTQQPALHMVFKGHPGTGKTEFARIAGKILFIAGALTKGHLVEVTRSDLTGAYIGQSEPKTIAKLKEAMGGVLFIDEAYSLVKQESPRDYGHEIIATINKFMEDYRSDLVVIVAGYPREMDKFINTNPGLLSRFKYELNFKGYSNPELIEISKIFAKELSLNLNEPALKSMSLLFDSARLSLGDNFGNARFARVLVEKASQKQATRLVKLSSQSIDQLTEILEEDVPTFEELNIGKGQEGLYL